MLEFKCLRCGMVSHNPNDAANRYCGNCHVFLDDQDPAADEFVCTDCGCLIISMPPMDPPPTRCAMCEAVREGDAVFIGAWNGRKSVRGSDSGPKN